MIDPVSSAIIPISSGPDSGTAASIDAELDALAALDARRRTLIVESRS